MTLTTHLQGRLRNTSLPSSHGLLPLFEAVVNSIHAIEDAAPGTSRGRIVVEILRDTQQELALDSASTRKGDGSKDIVGFAITDTGVGFNEANMNSFLTLDSEHKATRGGRGVGRLLWLKAFDRVVVQSVYVADGGIAKSRAFSFSAAHGVSKRKTNDASGEAKVATTVRLEGFEKRYRDTSRKTALAISNSLFEHCLWYFVREGGAPSILVKDEGSSIDLDQIYEEHMVSSAAAESVELKGVSFDLTHIRLKANTSNSHVIAFCAASRMVKEEKLAGKIAGLYGRLRDDDRDFVYLCYVTSPFLDQAVRSERTDFDIAEHTTELFAETEISLGEIREKVLSRAAAHLAPYLDENKKRAKERVETFVSQRAPRYRPILSRIPEEKLAVDPGISDKELELTLHKLLAEVEEELLATGHDVLQPKDGEAPDDYQARLNKYLKMAEDIKKSDLANYVSHRRVILEILEKAIQRRDDGHYAREDLIHSLIMPMRTDSNEVALDSCNLWLIDERLAFHDYLASDKPLSSIPITGSTQTKEPDLLALNVYDNPVLVSEGQNLPLASIVVVEIKRPMRNDASSGETKDPIEQALGYLARVRRGQVQTASGRPIPHSDNIPGFCYAICDITSSVKHRCDILGLRPTHDHLGYFGYNPNLNAYLEVISFDGLVNAAKERNRAFFDKLGLPTT